MTPSLVPEAAFARVDSWIGDHLEFFNPVVWNVPEERSVRRKAFGELSTYLCFRAWCGFAAPPKLHEFVVDIANSKAFLALLYGRPSEFLVFASALSYPAEAKALQAGTRQALQEMAAEPAVRATERPPHRHLDYISCCRTVLEDPTYGADLSGTVFELSILSNPLLAGCISREDAYAFTHSVFFATNFGRDLSVFRERPRLVPNVDDVDALICRAVFERDLDLALELATSRMIVSDADSPALSWCVDKALHAVATTGHLPAPPGLQIENRTAFAKAFCEWLERYHTMIVLGFTLAYGLGHKREFHATFANAENLSRFGGILSATYRANVYESCVLAMELLASGGKDLPGSAFQMNAVLRMLRRHLALVESDSDPGLLADAMRLGELSETAGTREGMESVNRLVRLVLPELERFSTRRASP